jgi:phosphohistidine phosphatase
MVTLSLLRHAKSAWNLPGLRDFDRLLAPRGEKAAPRMGRFIAENGLEPDLILCSPAARAKATLELVLPELAARPDVQFTEGLYGMGPGDMLRLIRALPQSCRHAMLVGHNPAMQALALDLAGVGDAGAIEALGAKFPTGALAVFDFDCGWAEIAPGGGTLRLFMTPRALPSQ